MHHVGHLPRIKASASPNASRYCTGKASLSDRSSGLPFGLLSVNSKKSQWRGSTVALTAFSMYKFWYGSVCTRCQTKHCSNRRRLQELFPLWPGGQSETTRCLYSTANRRRATTCQSISVDELSFKVQLLRN